MSVVTNNVVKRTRPHPRTREMRTEHDNLHEHEPQRSQSSSKMKTEGRMHLRKPESSCSSLVPSKIGEWLEHSQTAGTGK